MAITDGIARLYGVREHTEGYPVDLCRNAETGRLVIRATNEGGNNVTEVDLWDLVSWLRLGSAAGLLEAGFSLRQP